VYVLKQLVYILFAQCLPAAATGMRLELKRWSRIDT